MSARLFLKRRAVLAGLVAGLCVAGSAAAPLPSPPRAELPARLTDQEFWTLIDEFSEPNGFFRSDNLVSNEDTLQVVIPDLLQKVKPGGVYLGVGPDQNFTYIVALRPRMAFIIDIRRGNLQEHLMYKALLEASADRAEFLSLLFSRPRPPGLGRESTAVELFTAYGSVAPSAERYTANLQSILTRLARHRGRALSEDDREGVAYVYRAFYESGPELAYSMGGAFGRGGMWQPTFRDLQTATDGRGVSRSFLSTEDGFQSLKALEDANLLVPLVGDFAGAKALHSVSGYLRDHGATVGVFYTSNVEQYLFQDGVWPDFEKNVAELPMDASSTFVRSCFNGCVSPFGRRTVMLLDSMIQLVKDFNDGKIHTYWDVLAHAR